jgi:hypothetical protein
MGGGLGGGSPLGGLGGGMPPMGMGGMGGMGGGMGMPPSDLLGGLGGGGMPPMGGQQGMQQPPMQLKPMNVWEVINKLLKGEPVKKEKINKVLAGQNPQNMLQSKPQPNQQVQLQQQLLQK